MSDENIAGGPTIIDNGVLFDEALRHITARRLEAVNVNRFVPMKVLHLTNLRALET